MLTSRYPDGAQTMVTSPKTSMRLFILGATGGTGRALIDQALERGHRVTAFVRSPQKLGSPREGVTVLQGDPRSVDRLEAPSHLHVGCRASGASVRTRSHGGLARAPDRSRPGPYRQSRPG